MYQLKFSGEEIEKRLDTLIFENVQIASEWVEDTTYSGFGYKTDIVCAGVTENYDPIVTFSPEDVTKNIFASVAHTGDGVVTIFANEIPTDTITLLKIRCDKVKEG